MSQHAAEQPKMCHTSIRDDKFADKVYFISLR